MDDSPARRRSAWLLTSWAVGLVAVAALIGVVSVGLAAAASGAGVPTGWSEISEAFGVVNGVFSALALVIVGVTLWVQFRELQMQRSELREQRQTMDSSLVELRRNAEANVRARHMDLLKLAIENEDLAAVWPPFEPDEQWDHARQFLYANLVLQHQAMMLRVGGRDVREVEAALRFCFKSPVVREYWEATRGVRATSPVVDPVGKSFEALCEAISREAGTAASG